MNKQKILVGVSFIATVAIFVLAINFYKGHQQKKLTFLASENASLFVPKNAPMLGNKDAKVYLVEFLDPECESCRAFSPYVKKLMATYPNQIRLVIRYMPFHKNSKYAIKILEGARLQGKYWEVLDTLFKYQPYWGNHHNPRPELIWDFLKETTVNIEEIRKNFNNKEFDSIIARDFQDGQKLGVRKTPSFFVNGKPLERFGYIYLKEMVEAELIKK